MNCFFVVSGLNLVGVASNKQEFSMPQSSESGNLRGRPAAQIVEDLVEQSQEALEAGAHATAELQDALRAGAQATAELNDIRRRADEALDWRVQLRRHPWLPMVAAIGTSVLLYAAFARRR